MKPPSLKSLRIRNFKAVRDSGVLKLTPLTVFIGNNGSGKSSLVEAMETLQTCVVEDIDAAMQMWRGIEHVRNKSRQRQTRFDKSGAERSSKPIGFELRGRAGRGAFVAKTAVNERGAGNELFIEEESVKYGGVVAHRNAGNRVETRHGNRSGSTDRCPPGTSILGKYIGDYVGSWQFLSLWPGAMGSPVPQTRTRGPIRLARDGRNLAEYLLDIRKRDLSVFEGIVDTLKFVLPYAGDIQPALTSELERAVYLQMAERDFKVPGWLLSTGTLRILALLAVLRHPAPPSLTVIEEVENGLDPRTIHLLVDEIRNVVQAGRQVIVTTHSPYLLDLLPLPTIVFCDRDEAGDAIFYRPADDKERSAWAKNFGPGQLYTMSRLSRRAGE